MAEGGEVFNLDEVRKEISSIEGDTTAPVIGESEQSDAYEIEEELFAKEDRDLHKNDFILASNFARQMLNHILSKYQLNDNPPETLVTKFPYCEHIGEAIIAISFVNRLQFKLIFEKNKELLESDFSYEKVVYDFVKNFYVEGNVEQFLIVCGFIVDLTIYCANVFEKQRADSLCNLFGDLFRFVMRDIFLEKGGGWLEVKKQARPWWRTYRNYIHSNYVAPFAIDFHDPVGELTNEIYTLALTEIGFTTKMITTDEHKTVLLSKKVPKPDRISPICDS